MKTKEILKQKAEDYREYVESFLDDTMCDPKQLTRDGLVEIMKESYLAGLQKGYSIGLLRNKEQTEERPDKAQMTALVLLIGTNYAKSLDVIRILQQVNHKHRRIIVASDLCADIDGYEVIEEGKGRDIDFSFSGTRVMLYNNRTMQLLKRFKDGDIVFYNCGSFLPPNSKVDTTSLLIRRRQNNVDIYVTAFDFAEVPAAFCTFATDVIIFKAIGSASCRKDNLKDYTTVAQCFDRVQRVASGEEAHPTTWPVPEFVGKKIENPNYFERITL